MIGRDAKRRWRHGRRVVVLAPVELRRGAVGVALAALLAVVLIPVAATPASALGLVAVPDTLTALHDRPTSGAAPGVLGNDVTVLGTTAVLDSSPSNGSVTLRSNGSYTYTPKAGFVGTDSFTYHDSGLIPSNSAKVTITVTNHVPTAADDGYTMSAGGTLTIPGPGVLTNDTDADGDPIHASLVDGGGNGSLSVSSNGGFTFKPGGSFSGLRTFTYRATDGIASSSTATVSIQVQAGATPTPPPPPTPTPRPTPTPAPIAPPPPPSLPVPSVPVPSAPVPVPSVSVPPVPVPTAAPTPTVRPTPPVGPSPSTPPASGGPAATTSASGPAPGGASGGSGDGSGAAGIPGGPGAGERSGPAATAGRRSGSSLSPPFAIGSGASGVGTLAGAGVLRLGGFEWAVPSLVLTVPGALLVLIVATQAAGGAIWLPLVRRFRDGNRPRRAGELAIRR